jgi:hypothetical protein
MRKRTSALILSGIIATGAVGAVVITPASATTSDNLVASRLAHIKSALSGLVSDGTLTQSQADKVAGTLDSKLAKQGMGGPGGPDRRMRMMGIKGMTQTRDAAAKALGLTTDKLRAALQSGKSLADVAKDQKVSVNSVVKAMVTATENALAGAVKDGTLTRAQADKMKTSLTQRITDRVNGVRPDVGPGHGPRGSGRSPSTGNVHGEA